MRGKACTRRVTIPSGRITPAYAGKSRNSGTFSAGTEDHPRLCGEKLFEFGNSGFMTGSPPPMRGKVLLFFAGFVQLRITPAYAGKRYEYWESAAPDGDHPRLCGEKGLLHCR